MLNVPLLKSTALLIILQTAFLCNWKTPIAIAAEEKEKSVLVQTEFVKRIAKTNIIELPGTVLPWATTSLGAEIEGRVDEIYVREGDKVRVGDPLIRMRTRPLELQRDFAIAEKNRVVAQLEELKAGSRIEVLAAGQALVEKAQARMQFARNELTRIEKLYKNGVVSVNEFDNAKTLAEESTAEFNERFSQWEELKAGPRIEQIQREEANLQASIAKIKIIEDQIERGSLRSPFNAVVVRKDSEVGQWLEAGDPGLTLAVVDPVRIEINVPQHLFNQIGKGSTGNIHLDTRSVDSSGMKFKGQVVEKISVGNATSRTFPVRLRVDNPKGALAAGMLVQVELESSKPSQQNLFVPKDALVRSPSEIILWVIRSLEDNSLTAEKIRVTPGEAQGNMIAVQIEKGASLKEGDQVVVHGNERMRPDTKVVLTQPAP
ncbi:MAG: efflux RND transporter periplasmic adaptor subunit [Candidatus Nitrohelix vancouverensis]|uniref:Efflux RND transporter periplasmic adaptor subunit n=1 Tax=Candidatus Nitrohelix vancouverensis TaxID=2705534 RepID=A0A7T0C2N1_9BACT|nr:MAG: efflux RND transporter periplasmic adaptor subunit [Candidatus Nitrohelix vancouverensis]